MAGSACTERGTCSGEAAAGPSGSGPGWICTSILRLSGADPALGRPALALPVPARSEGPGAARPLPGRSGRVRNRTSYPRRRGGYSPAPIPLGSTPGVEPRTGLAPAWSSAAGRRLASRLRLRAHGTGGSCTRVFRVRGGRLPAGRRSRGAAPVGDGSAAPRYRAVSSCSSGRRATSTLERRERRGRPAGCSSRRHGSRRPPVNRHHCPAGTRTPICRFRAGRPAVERQGTVPTGAAPVPPT